MDIKRRELLRLAGAVAATGVVPVVSGLQGRVHAAVGDKKVVVIGGGFGGSTAAKYLKLWGQGAIGVIQVDKNAKFIAPILSNLVLNGQKTITNLSFDLATSARNNGNEFLQGTAKIVRANRTVEVTKPDGSVVALPYDKIVVSPGIDFNYLPSMAAANGTIADRYLPIPHAWKSGDQVVNLKVQIDRMPTRTGKFVLCIPKKPYRCPPGPYERACVVADIVKRVKGGGKVIVFDANLPDPATPDDKYSAIQAERHTFTTAFQGMYAGIVEYVSNAELLEVSRTGGQFGVKTAKVRLGDGSVRTENCHVLNVIPEHRAGDVVRDAGLVPSGRFAPVDLQSYASTVDPDIHVLGDSHDSSQPKAGHIANSEAKWCADAIVREFGLRPPRLPDEVPVTNSACYSPITFDLASWLTAGYRYNADTGLMDRIPESFNEAQSLSSDNYKMMLAWARNLFADTFNTF